MLPDKELVDRILEIEQDVKEHIADFDNWKHDHYLSKDIQRFKEEGHRFLEDIDNQKKLIGIKTDHKSMEDYIDFVKRLKFDNIKPIEAAYLNNSTKEILDYILEKYQNFDSNDYLDKPLNELRELVKRAKKISYCKINELTNVANSRLGNINQDFRYVNLEASLRICQEQYELVKRIEMLHEKFERKNTLLKPLLEMIEKNQARYNRLNENKKILEKDVLIFNGYLDCVNDILKKPITKDTVDIINKVLGKLNRFSRNYDQYLLNSALLSYEDVSELVFANSRLIKQKKKEVYQAIDERVGLITMDLKEVVDSFDNYDKVNNGLRGYFRINKKISKLSAVQEKLPMHKWELSLLGNFYKGTPYFESKIKNKIKEIDYLSNWIDCRIGSAKSRKNVRWWVNAVAAVAILVGGAYAYYRPKCIETQLSKLINWPVKTIYSYNGK